MPPPRRKKPPRLKKVNVSEKAKWKSILRDVDKGNIPIDLLLSISVNLIDGTKVDIDVKELLAAGADPAAIEQMLELKFRAIEDFIIDIDFLISIDNVAQRVQPITDQILKDL
jgi:hypothetical protein